MSWLGLLALPYWKTFSIRLCLWHSYGSMVPGLPFTMGLANQWKGLEQGITSPHEVVRYHQTNQSLTFPIAFSFLTLSTTFRNILGPHPSFPGWRRHAHAHPKHPTRTCGLLGSVATEARCMACSIVKVSCVVAKCKAKKCWETWQVIFPQPRAGRQRLCGVTDQRCVGISWIPIIVAESWQTLPGSSTSSPPSHCHPDNSPRYFHQRIWDDPCCLAEMAQRLTNEQKSMVQPWHLRKLQFDIQWFQRKRKPGKFNDQKFLFTDSL